MIEKIVLTGAPGSGKSSVNRILEYEYGERIIVESAEDMIKTLKRQGYEKPWELKDFQDRVLKLQLQREAQLEKFPGRVFIDRGVLDQLAYYQIQGKSCSEALQIALTEHEGYYKVFLLERGEKCENNDVRRETAQEANRHQKLHYENYTNAGYKVERIKWNDDPSKRAKEIIKRMEEKDDGTN